MRVLVIGIAVAIFLALLFWVSPQIEEDRQRCHENGGIWLPKQLICIGDDK